MTADEIAAIRTEVNRLRTFIQHGDHPCPEVVGLAATTLDELAQIALRLLAHLEHANAQADRARDLVAAVELKANAGTLDELLVAALARYKE